MLNCSNFPARLPARNLEEFVIEFGDRIKFDEILIMFELERTSLLMSTFSHSSQGLLLFNKHGSSQKNATVVVGREFKLISEIGTIGLLSNVRAYTRQPIHLPPMVGL